MQQIHQEVRNPFCSLLAGTDSAAEQKSGLVNRQNRPGFAGVWMSVTRSKCNQRLRKFEVPASQKLGWSTSYFQVRPGAVSRQRSSDRSISSLQRLDAASPFLVTSKCRGLLMPSEIDALAHMLDEAEALLRPYGQVRWAEWLAKDARLIRSLDGYGIDHLLSAYGGMGSVNDVVLQRSNGRVRVLLDVGDNERFDKLRSEIYDLARRLRAGEWQ